MAQFPHFSFISFVSQPMAPSTFTPTRNLSDRLCHSETFQESFSTEEEFKRFGLNRRMRAGFGSVFDDMLGGSGGGEGEALLAFLGLGLALHPVHQTVPFKRKSS